MRYLFLRVDGFILNMLASGAFMLRFASRIVYGPGVGDGAVAVTCHIRSLYIFFYLPRKRCVRKRCGKCA